MRVFISWSGTAERRVAEALKTALEVVTTGRVSAFVSSQDIAKGERGVRAIDSSLNATDYGVVVVSKANHRRPWVNYEAGALAEALDRPVATILLDLRPSDLEGPLAAFQATAFTHAQDMLRLLREVALAADPAMNPRSIDVLSSDAWPTLLASWQPDRTRNSAPVRTQEEMLAEIVERVRAIESNQSSRSEAPDARSHERARHQEAEAIAVRVRDRVDRWSDGRIQVEQLRYGSGRLDLGLRPSEAATSEDRRAVRERLQAHFPDVRVRLQFIELLPEVENLDEAAADGGNG